MKKEKFNKSKFHYRMKRFFTNPVVEFQVIALFLNRYNLRLR
ncbi:MAG: hypothetical protein WC933_01465 [Candidatus Paceibacterota bacterium]